MAATDSRWSMSSQQSHPFPLVVPATGDDLNQAFRSAFAKQSQSQSPSPTFKSNNPFGPNAPRRRSSPKNSISIPGAPTSPTSPAQRRRRGSSLTERFPGDLSHSPLAMLTAEHKKANAAQRHRKRPSDIDQIDALDSVPGGGYHHEGPFDATLASRNLNVQTSPVAAVAESNAAALKATPVEKIRDALERHVPLDGVADVPPGMRDGLGRAYDYHETNVMTEDGGSLGKEFGVGERKDPYYDDEEHGNEHGIVGDRAAPAEIELRDRKKKSVDIGEDEVEGDSSVARRHSHSLTEGLKKRIGSLRRKKDHSDE